MSEYDMMKKIFNRKYHSAYNPCKDYRTDKHTRESWKEDWESDKLLLYDRVLFVFDKDGKFEFISTNY